jgi:hypothetical protein
MSNPCELCLKHLLAYIAAGNQLIDAKARANSVAGASNPLCLAMAERARARRRLLRFQRSLTCRCANRIG